ncbi:hypothetical protein BABINDRAFT_163812 [Babjeviella inositovora NRRL Y-12698]|uniref:Deacetylase sirtuin-type domain-containing protein n=1 Tax=Babjeviella inositovora NRRL Y-12698 TaxID=984486 RepID=A0A1E3QH99_9ASCO|nr:uncharacterized protein BABINDRAFT_163812 [Babjeviella inositovora NRRL Y-12698]ODQ77076.1 hypothetical protein BABINDRAFT_163812 [Babjeviella inositovora NRRL Y-12698]
MSEIILLDSSSDSDREISKHDSETLPPKKIQKLNTGDFHTQAGSLFDSPSPVVSSSSPASDSSSEVGAELDEVVYQSESPKAEAETEGSENTANGITETQPNGKPPVVMNGITLPDITKEQCSKARSYLKLEGSMKFLDHYLPTTAAAEDILNLIMMLGFVPKDLPLFKNEENNLIQLIKTLQKAMNRVSQMRTRLSEFNTIDQLCAQIEKSSKILVLTGAGISTSLGIPDFRSSKGFYSQLQYLGLSDPQEVFDLEFFREDPNIFYSIAHMILPPENAFTPLHGFIKLLQDKGKLLRNYTQNIDNLEENVGIFPEKLIQCHGSFASATCVTCKFSVKGDAIFDDIRKQQIPLCPFCLKKRERLFESESPRYDIQSYGVMKPDITFFGEALPALFHDNIKKDVMECDLLICIGTSLKVAPVSEIVNKVPAEVPQILVNRDLVGHCEFDLNLLGFCDQVVCYLCTKLGVDTNGWRVKHERFDAICASGLVCIDLGASVGCFEIADSLPKKEEIEEVKEEAA